MAYKDPNEMLVPQGLTKEELDARARMVPEYLIDMYQAYEGRKPNSPQQQQLFDWLYKDPKGFIVQMRAAEADYKNTMVKFAEADALAKRAESEKPVDAADDGAVKVEELIERLLGEAVP